MPLNNSMSSSSPEEGQMESSALINAKWWAGIWETIEHWAFLGVVLTLAIEFAASHLAKPQRKIIDDARELEMVRLNHEAAEANRKAAEAALALEKFKTPRSLTVAQQERITAKLKPFAGMPFDFLIQTDPESITLMEQIGSALKAAGLSWEPWASPAPITPVFTQPGTPQAGIVAFTGLMIQIDNAKTPQWGDAVVAIRDALQAEGIEADAKGIIDNTVTPNAIHIYIGRKPQ